MRTIRFSAIASLGMGLLAFFLVAGCGKTESTQTTEPEVPGGMEGEMEMADFKGGPDNAKVKVVAYYPGRHEEALGAIKGLLEEFPGKVQVEVVDWRRPVGLERREKAGLTCAGVTINGEFTLEVKGEKGPEKVMFVRDMGGEWTKANLVAAVKQELAE